MTTKYHVYEELDKSDIFATGLYGLSTAGCAMFSRIAVSGAFSPDLSQLVRVAFGLGSAIFAAMGCAAIRYAYVSAKDNLCAHKIRNHMKNGATEHLLVHVGSLTPTCIHIPARRIDLSL